MLVHANTAKQCAQDTDTGCLTDYSLCVLKEGHIPLSNRRIQPICDLVVVLTIWAWWVLLSSYGRAMSVYVTVAIKCHHGSDPKELTWQLCCSSWGQTCQLLAWILGDLSEFHTSALIQVKTLCAPVCIYLSVYTYTHIVYNRIYIYMRVCICVYMYIGICLSVYPYIYMQFKNCPHLAVCNHQFVWGMAFARLTTLAPQHCRQSLLLHGSQTGPKLGQA